MLYKLIGIILSALLITVLQASVASAGCGGHGGGLRHAKSYNDGALHQSRTRKARSVAAARQKKILREARVGKKDTAAKVAEAAPVADQAATADAGKASADALNVASVEQTCTKFFAETGTTVTVECAKQ